MWGGGRGGLQGPGWSDALLAPQGPQGPCGLPGPCTDRSDIQGARGSPEGVMEGELGTAGSFRAGSSF